VEQKGRKSSGINRVIVTEDTGKKSQNGYVKEGKGV